MTGRQGLVRRRGARVRGSGSLAVALLGALGCSGGQTGESGALDGCSLETRPVPMATELPDGESLAAWVQRLAGTRTVPLHWLDESACQNEGLDERAAARCAFPSPSESTSTSELEVTLSSRNEARESACRNGMPIASEVSDAGATPDGAEQLAVLVEGRLRSADGRVDAALDGWLETAVRNDLGPERAGRFVGRVGPFATKLELSSGGLRGFLEQADRRMQGTFPVPAWSECGAQPLASEVEAPVPVARVSSALSALALSHPDLLEGQTLQLGTALWREHACSMSAVSSERGPFSGYRLWVETRVGAEGASDEPWIGTVDVEDVAGCDGCARVTLLVSHWTASEMFAGTLPTEQQINGSLSVSGRLDPDGFELTRARLQLAGSGTGGEERERSFELRLVR